MTAALDAWFAIDEPLGALLGLAIVLCLIRQNVWAWPLGIAYVGVTVTVLIDARLYANLALHVFAFLPLNVYGWYSWRRSPTATGAALAVTRAGAMPLALLLAGSAAAALALGAAFAQFTDAALPYWDNALLAGSIAAMWLSARKKLASWAFWLGIDAVSAGVYFARDLPLYAALYLVYVPLAVAGWRAWRASMARVPLQGGRTYRQA